MFVFVILHYLSEEMTVKCVDKVIETCAAQSFHIVVVDNASSNGSGIRLKMRYNEMSNCTVILNEKNLGFAQGNNVGYCYAKKHFNPQYIIIMNNDVIIEDSFFLDKISKIHEDTQYYILGPDILACKTGIHQNPMSLKGYSRNEVQKIIADRKRWMIIYPLHYFIEYIKAKTKGILKKIIKKKPTSVEVLNPYALEKQIINPVLHGACYVFSGDFIEREPIAFNSNTFLYFEEDILHYTCMKKGYKMVYDSSVVVQHMEDVATNIQFKSEYKKKKMKYTNLINSATVLLDLMEEERV